MVNTSKVHSKTWGEDGKNIENMMEIQNFYFLIVWRKYSLLCLAFHHDTSPCRSAVIPGLQPFSLDSKPDRKRDLGTLLTRLNTPRHHSSITGMILKKISKSQKFVFFHHFCLMVTIFSWSAHISFTPDLGTRSATGGESRPGRVVSRGPVGTQANNRCMDTSLGIP